VKEDYGATAEKPLDKFGRTCYNQKGRKCLKNHENVSRGASLKEQAVAKLETL
jgi:hypothetical protein